METKNKKMDKRQRKEIVREARLKMRGNVLLDIDKLHSGEFEKRQDEYIEAACKNRGWTLQDFYATNAKELNSLLKSF